MEMNKVEHRVIYADTDAGQVVYYGNYFKWFESGRREIFRNLGIDYKKLIADGYLIPVVEAHCNYYKPAQYDDVVLIETRITEVKERSIRFEYKVFRKKEKILLAEGYTVNVFVDAKKMKSAAISQEIKVKLKIDQE